MIHALISTWTSTEPSQQSARGDCARGMLQALVTSSIKNLIMWSREKKKIFEKIQQICIKFRLIRLGLSNFFHTLLIAQRLMNLLSQL